MYNVYNSEYVQELFNDSQYLLYKKGLTYVVLKMLSGQYRQIRTKLKSIFFYRLATECMYRTNVVRRISNVLFFYIYLP